MAKEKTIKTSQKQKSVNPIKDTNPIKRNSAMTLLEFKNIDFAHFEDGEFLIMLEEFSFFDYMWHPTKSSIKNGILYLQECKASTPIPDTEFTSQGKIIMVGAHEFLGNCLKIHKIIEHRDFLRQYRLAVQNKSEAN